MTAHDPGPDAARERAEAVTAAPAVPIVRDGHRIHVGTASWTDRTLTARGVFYPAGASTPESRLRYYATRYSLVEADAFYYALPSRAITELWVERTPPAPGFTIDIKAHALMTEHPTEVARLPPLIRDALPAAMRSRTRIYAKDLPPEVQDEVWRIFREAMAPLAAAGKLGAVLLQYPPWFVPGATTKRTIVAARDRLTPLPIAVEFRQRRWFGPGAGERTLAFLAEQRIPLVVVDEPQGLNSSVPPIVEVPSPGLAIVRFHGRRTDVWEQRGVSTTERYRYLYDREELADWVPRVRVLATKATATHVVFNNCYANYATTNAWEFAALLAAAV